MGGCAVFTNGYAPKSLKKKRNAYYKKRNKRYADFVATKSESTPTNVSPRANSYASRPATRGPVNVNSNTQGSRSQISPLSFKGNSFNRRVVDRRPKKRKGGVFYKMFGGANQN